MRSSVVRLPPTVHHAGRYGFASGLLAIAQATGRSGYLGEGSNRWPSADTRDVARLYRLAIESAAAGSRLHAVAEEGITLLEIAETIGRRLGVPVGPVAAEQAEQHFGYLLGFVRLDNPTSSAATREAFNWTPTRPGLLTDLEDADLDSDPTNEPSTTSAS